MALKLTNNYVVFSLITFFKNASIIKLYTNDAKSKLVETTYDKFDKESKPPPKIHEILLIKKDYKDSSNVLYLYS